VSLSHTRKRDRGESIAERAVFFERRESEERKEKEGKRLRRRE